MLMKYLEAILLIKGLHLSIQRIDNDSIGWQVLIDKKCMLKRADESGFTQPFSLEVGMHCQLGNQYHRDGITR